MASIKDKKAASQREAAPKRKVEIGDQLIYVMKNRHRGKVISIERNLLQ